MHKENKKIICNLINFYMHMIQQSNVFWLISIILIPLQYQKGSFKKSANYTNYFICLYLFLNYNRMEHPNKHWLECQYFDVGASFSAS
jgi:hypothetical protein